MRKVLILVLVVTLSPLSRLAAQSTAPVQQTDKLAARLKATLPDYKGPSRFRGRKALITFSPDNRLVAMSGTNRSITIWDTETGTLKAKLTAKDGISGFAFSPDGKVAATRDYQDKRVRLWDVQTWKERATLTGRKNNLETKLKTGFSFEEEFGPVPINPEGTLVLAEREDDLVAVADIASAQVRFTLNHDTRGGSTKEVFKMALFGRAPHFLVLQTGFSNDGRLVFTINGDKSPKIWNAATGALQASIENNERVYRASFDPTGTRLLTVEQQGGMKLWNTETGTLIGEVAKKGFTEYVMKGFEFSPDGKHVATFLLGDTRIWDVQSAQLKFKLPDSETTDALFSPDGQWLVTGSHDNQSAGKIWNVETGVLKLALPSIGSKSTSVEFNNQGTILATANDSGIKLWDPKTGELLATLNDARYPVAFSSDGRILVTGGRKDTALLWEIPQPQSKMDSSQE
jgi:WD40 repeat protein